MERDKILYKSFLEGDKNALQELVMNYKNNLIYFISRFVKNIDISEDIFQDVVVYILENKEYYDFNYSFKTYLYMIAKSKACNYLKQNKNIENIDENEELQEANLLEEIILNKERKKKVQNIINKMPQEYQLVIYLTQIEDLSHKETAVIMGKKESQIKKLSYNARKKLRQLFIDEKLVEVRNNKIIKLLVLFIVFGVISTSIVFAKDIKRIINKIFFGGSVGISTSINNGYIANKNDVEQNDYIELSELVMDDNYIGLSFCLNDSDYFNLNVGQEDNNIHFEKIIVYDENNNILYCNNKELFNAFCNKNELNYVWNECNGNYYNTGISIQNISSTNCIYNLYSYDFPKSKTIYADVENIVGNGEVIFGKWNLSMNLPEVISERTILNFKENTNIDNVMIDGVLVYPTNTVVNLRIKSDINYEDRKDLKTIEELRNDGLSSQEITNILAEYSKTDSEFQHKNIFEDVFIENAKGIKFYQDLDLSEGNKSVIDTTTNVISSKFTFSLTQYDITDTLYLNFNYSGKKYRVELLIEE